MFGPLFAGFLHASVGGIAGTGVACPSELNSDEYHLSSVCSPHLMGVTAFSATYRASLTPKPASQQVMVYRFDSKWFMRVAGFRWEHSGEVVTRRREIEISGRDATQVVSRVREASLERLGALPYYGSDDVICTDGVNLELAMSRARTKYSAAQHSCAGKTEINEIASTFRKLALKYDSDFEGLLYGLKD